ncbi:MAG: amidohydrolase family protein [Thermoprotei archaeon]|nr:amidohydrolase family protein [TACK group archaeon]
MVVEEADVLIKSTDVLTLNGPGYAKGVDLAIKGGRILNVGKDLKYDARSTINGKGKLFMPGLVDAHTHPFQIFLRGALRASGLKVHPFWLKVLVPFEAEMNEREGRVSAELAALNMIKKGITGFIDAGGPYPEVMAEVADTSGLRARVTYSTMDQGPESYVHTPEDNRNLVRKWSKGRVRGWYSVRQIMVSSEELMRKTAEYAKEDGAGITLHIAEEASEVDYAVNKWGKRPVELLNHVGLLSSGSVLAHSAFLSENDVKLIAAARASVAHCPFINLTHMNFPKVKEMIEAGVNVALGSDGGSMRALDLFTEINVMIAGHTAYYGTPYMDYDVISPLDALVMASSAGAAAMMEKDLGSISPGKVADLISVDMRRPGLMPMYNPTSVPLFATGSDVSDVIIDGKPVMLDGKVLTLDEQKIAEEVDEVYPEVQERLRKYAARRGIIHDYVKLSLNIWPDLTYGCKILSLVEVRA